MSVAGPGRARAPLDRLHEIAKTLMRKGRLEELLSQVLPLAAEDRPLRTAILISAVRGLERPFFWRGAEVSSAAMQEALERAHRAHAALAGGEPPPRPEPGCTCIPLVGAAEDVLGTLQLQWEGEPGEADQGFVAAFSDLLAIAMDRVSREEAIRQLYLQAQRATRAREDLLSTVSHDLKNLVSAIRANLTLLERVAELQAQEKPRAALVRIQRSADRMGRLIQDLLDTASVEAESLSVEPRRLEVAPLLAEALEAAAPMAGTRSIQLRLDVASSLPAIHADAARLQQVFANLLSNAIKFSPDGGTIVIRARPSFNAVTFSVEDRGPGIGEDDRPHLFDRFWRARRAAGLGYGLGLFIVKGIVKAHGGQVWVESVVGTGSTFFFTVPAAEVESLHVSPP